MDNARYSLSSGFKSGLPPLYKPSGQNKSFIVGNWNDEPTSRLKSYELPEFINWLIASNPKL